MAKSHQKFIKTHFDLMVPLFNKVSINKNTSVNDLDVIPKSKVNRDSVKKHIIKTITHIHNVIPKLTNYLQKLP